MSWEAWYTLAVVVVTMVVLARNWLPPAGAMGGAMIAVLVPGIVTPAQAFAGFSNPAPITIAALYVVARAVEKTGVLSPVVGWMLGGRDSDRSTLARVTVPTTAMSGFLNNTPIVAMLIPQLEAWSRAHDRSVSRYLMPLSFAAILGGAVTLMGTATNIIASGLLEAIGEEPLGFFEITWVGLPIAIVALVALIVLSPIVLPERRSASGSAEEEVREFVVDMIVVSDGPIDGISVQDAGLRSLTSVFLASLERQGETIAPVAPSTRLHGGDRLRFVGRSGDVVDLHAISGLGSPEQDQVTRLDSGQMRFFEAVIGGGSPLIGRSVREAGFRSRYQAAIVAVHRAGERVDDKVGDIVIRVGDTLLLISDPGFKDRWGDRRAFLLISPMRPAPPVSSPKAPFVALVGVGMVVLAVSGVMPLVTAALLAALILVVGGAVTSGEARRSINLDIIVTIAAAFGLAAAMEVSGLGSYLADRIIDIAAPFGQVAVLAAIVFATMVLKEIITNKGSVLLLTPIAFSIAAATGGNPRGYAIAIAVASALAFLTPIGYQTNTMVYGPGGYRFTDYFRLGFPLTVISFIGIVAIVPLKWPL
ncbi:MAG: SLC13 family permease [Actinomycetia bacterium]|nr:SLC13 family permease [Actinomycetes bacterium]